MFLRRGAHIMGEGITTDEHHSELDTEMDGFRVDLLFASLFSKMVPVVQDRRERTLQNLLVAILTHDLPPQTICAPAVFIVANKKVALSPIGRKEYEKRR